LLGSKLDPEEASFDGLVVKDIDEGSEDGFQQEDGHRDVIKDGTTGDGLPLGVQPGTGEAFKSYSRYGFEEGSDDGTLLGFKLGIKDSLKDSFQDGRRDGMKNGTDDGSLLGVERGSKDGSSDGLIEGIDKVSKDGLEDGC
jgi:hypothetical protein